MKIGEQIKCRVGGAWTVVEVKPFADGKGPEYGTPRMLARGCRYCGVEVVAPAPPPPGPPQLTITHDGFCPACRDYRRGCDDAGAEEEAARVRARAAAKAARTRERIGHAPKFAVGDVYRIGKDGQEWIVDALTQYDSRSDGLPRTIYSLRSYCRTCDKMFRQARGHNANLNANCPDHRTPEGRRAWRAAHDAAF